MVTYQCKIPLTALCSVWLLGKRLSPNQWISLAILVAGVVLSHESRAEPSPPPTASLSFALPPPPLAATGRTLSIGSRPRGDESLLRAQAALAMAIHGASRVVGHADVLGRDDVLDGAVRRLLAGDEGTATGERRTQNPLLGVLAFLLAAATSSKSSEALRAPGGHVASTGTHTFSNKQKG